MDSIKPRPPERSERLTPPRQAQAGRTAKPGQESGLNIPHKKRIPLILMILGGFVVVVGVVAVCALLWYQNALLPRSDSSAPVVLTVEPGASIDQVAKELEQKSVIKSSLAFTVYAKLHNKALKAGTYALTPNQPAAEIADWLHEGRVSIRKITILPGKTLKQTRESLINDGFSESDVNSAFARTYDHPLLADKPATAPLEGYIFPETYFVAYNATAEDVLIRAFDELESRVQAEDLRSKLAARGFTLFQGITLASIVGREVSDPQRQTQVAQVFETRLQRGMMLGSDPTYQYAASLLGVEPSVDIDSPYNTRKHKGLPPSAIANFNLSALQAVAEPAAGDYLYFVSGDDGVIHFSHSLEEHQQNILEFCKKLCSQA